MSARILVADDEAAVRSALAALCRALGHETIEAADGGHALQLAHDRCPDVVLLDIYMPGRSGMEILPDLVALERAPAVVILTGRSDVPTAVSAMRQGAADYLEKPATLEVLEASLERVLKNRALLHERDRLRVEVSRLRAGPILGESRAIQQVLDIIERVAATPRTTVLILGESGVGKELVARAVHERSSRSEEPFVALNCAALSAGLLEAELFGYEPGAFTGAVSKGREGLIAAAEGGSLFLDEIGELDRELQAKLLRVLQERVYRRVGGHEDRAMNVRILTSTNRDLSSMVAHGTFREDLFYRLNVMSIRVPPLRERREDVPILAGHFLEHFQHEFGRTFNGFSSAAMQRLCEHGWPGNVRELRNAIERAALLAQAGEVQSGHLFLDVGTPESASVERSGVSLPLQDRTIRGMERALILRVLEETSGNRSEAARVLGVNRTTLYNKLREYELPERT